MTTPARVLSPPFGAGEMLWGRRYGTRTGRLAGPTKLMMASLPARSGSATAAFRSATSSMANPAVGRMEGIDRLRVEASSEARRRGLSGGEKEISGLGLENGVELRGEEGVAEGWAGGGR